MRGVLVRNVGISILALALTVFAGCNDDPLGFDVKDSQDILVDPSSMVLSAGRTAQIRSRTVNQGLEPTFEQIAAQRDATCGAATITIEEDLSLAPAVPPGIFDVTGGSTLGTTCVVLTSGSLTESVDITLVAADIVLSAPTVVRSGDTGAIVGTLVDVDLNEVLPYDATDVVWVSDSPVILDVSAGDGSYTTAFVGTAVVTAVWPGQEANGTTGTGVLITKDIPIQVQSGIATGAYFAVTGDSTLNLGSSPAGETVILDVFVQDLIGNRNTVPEEILAVTVVSANPAAVQATAQIFTDDPLYGAGSIPVVTLETLSAAVGVAITGFVQTSTSGNIPFAGVFSVLAPSITALTPDNGDFAVEATISGTGFVAAGFTTLVWMDGEQLGNFTIVSDTEITAQVPTYADPGTHNLVVTVGGVPSTEAVTWTQNNSCVAQDFPDVPGFDGPFVPVSIPLECNGTLAGPQDDWFFTDISTDALGGAADISVTLAPQWEAIKDIDWFYCTADISCTFAIDELPDTFTIDLEAGTHLWVADDFAGFGGNNTPQPYTVIVTID